MPLWPLSTLATLSAYAVVSYSALREVRQFDALREQYAYQSMENRVPLPKPAWRANQLTDAGSSQLERIEKQIGASGQGMRPFLLQRLHEETVTRFVESQGFGVSRMIRPTEERLREEMPVPALPSPGPTILVEGSPGDLESAHYHGDKEPLNRLHEDSVVDFAYPPGFGYVKDRRQVAGFLPHRFSRTPEAKHWKLQSVDLIGLLLHETPVAYVSAHLPRMEELAQAPTRPLDTFEMVGLEKLRAGEDLFVYSPNKTLRLLGSIRAATQCTTCHGCARGGLLGAFSYTLNGE
jgi:hypothetical protein